MSIFKTGTQNLKQLFDDSYTISFEGDNNIMKDDTIRSFVYDCGDECAKMVPEYGIMTERERAEFTNKVVEEVKEFINLRNRRPGITLLQFFNNQNLPKLERVFKRMMIERSSTAAVERSFSTLNNVLSDKRNRLNDGGIYNILMVKINESNMSSCDHIFALSRYQYLYDRLEKKGCLHTPCFS